MYLQMAAGPEKGGLQWPVPPSGFHKALSLSEACAGRQGGDCWLKADEEMYFGRGYSLPKVMGSLDSPLDLKAPHFLPLLQGALSPEQGCPNWLWAADVVPSHRRTTDLR